MLRTALGTLLALVSPHLASANTPEDVQGVGARTIAMGGAGTAYARDFSATYYAPANLAYCPQSEIGVSVRHTAYELELQGAADDPAPVETRDQTRVSAGFCNLLPFGFSFGMIFGTGLQNPMTLDQPTLDDTPRYLLYGEALEQLSIQLGLGYRVHERFSLGLGLSVLLNSNLNIAASIPFIEDTTVDASLQWNLKPRASLVVSAAAEPIDGLHLAATYRTALFHNLKAPTTVDVQLNGLFVEVDLLLESAAWYSPQQVSFGVSYEPIPMLTLAADVTWQDWSAHPGPYLIVTALEDEGVASDLLYAPREDLGLRDTVVPKIGAELRFNDVAFRAGYHYRAAVAPLPAKRSTLLDGSVHAVSVGGGYRFGDRPDDAELALDENGQPVVRANGSIDAFVRVSHMNERQVSRETDRLGNFRYGGNIIDVGLQMSLGWF